MSETSFRDKMGFGREVAGKSQAGRYRESDISDATELGKSGPFLGFLGVEKIFPLVGLGCEVSPSAQTPSKVNLFWGVLTHN